MSIKVQEVTKYYGEQKALDNISFEVRTGEIVGFLGPNGAGKSTMMKIITGFIPPTTGSVYVNGTEISDDNPETRKIIGYLPENNPLYPEMYVREYLKFVYSLYGRTDDPGKHIGKIIDMTGLGPEQKKKIGALSKGFRQRVGIAQALIHDPQVLILDEATSGLDPNQIIEIRNLIREAGREKTIMFSTHIMQEAEAVCDRIIIINRGTIMADELKSNLHSVLGAEKQIIKAGFDRDPGSDSLLAIPGIISAENTGRGQWLIEAEGTEDIRPALFAFAVRNNLTVLSLQKEESRLEEIFRHLTGN
ncbi:MAG TPA: ATP-binding cassette domain-containing protein [Bacteroidales bacterium]|nr:ATP-binding cassette domain-containing protein [Bacteroidales bacterium]HPF04305.1 ATP-binding cassette domain-containing protein [Bacteroidales bacterium]HPJ60263.1 ATP-binding cassette domain-containing protein [Bacteroidales bacterium]HPR11871.1 ATP-binding cassette domain-containing protein [Bacteroidales bacterium]HRW83980.1 ATP-binding cassette domain-containing protein [Bacteroidales bacterium]